MKHKYRMQIIVFAVLASIFAILLLNCGNGDLDVIEASGTIEATEIDISSKVQGEVLYLAVDEGSPVSAGDTIAIIDHETLDIQLAQAEAGVELAGAQLDLLLNGARIEDIRTAEEAVRQAKASLEIAKKDAERMERLLADQSVTQKQRDDAVARLEVTQAAYNSANQTLKKVKNIARPEELAAARAQLKQAEAARDALKKAVRDSHVQSPVSGTVTQTPFETGELVGPGSVLATVNKLDSLDLTIYVTEVELGHVFLNERATVTVDSYPEREFEGSVIYISPEAEFTPKNIQTKEDRVKLVYAVKIRIPNPDHQLKPGMPADAVLNGNSKNQ